MQDIEAENHTLNKRIAEIAAHEHENACLHHGLAHKLRDSIVICRQRRHSGLIVPNISRHSKSHSKTKLNTIVESLDSIPEIIDIDDYDLCDFNINLIKTRDELIAFEKKIVSDSDFKEKCIRKVKNLVESRSQDGTNKCLDLDADGVLRLQTADGVIGRIVNSFFHYSFWSSCDGKTLEKNSENHDENGFDASNAKKRKIAYGKFINHHIAMKSLIANIFTILTGTPLHEPELLEFIRSKLLENAVSQRNSGLYHFSLIRIHNLTANRYLVAEYE